MGQRILNAATGTTTGPLNDFVNGAIQATVSGTGAVSATVRIEVSNDNDAWITAGTITLSGTNLATDGFQMNASWDVIRAVVTAISGTGASVNVTVGA